MTTSKAEDWQERLERLVKDNPYTGIQEAASIIGVSADRIRKYIKAQHGHSADWEGYTGVSCGQRLARRRQLQLAEKIEDDDIELIIAKAVKEIGALSISAISKHTGINRNAITYRMQRRGTNLTEIVSKHLGDQAELIRRKNGSEARDKKPADDLIEVPEWMTRPLRSYRYIGLQYQNGVPA